MTQSIDEDDLRAYAEGVASAQLRTEIDSAAATDACLRAEIAVLQGLQALAIAERDAHPADELGWKRLKAKIESEEVAQPAPQNGLWWRVAAAVLAAVVIGQGAYIAMGPTGGRSDLYQTATEPTATFVLTIGFEDLATIEQVTQLLRSQGARIIDGPSALGLYRLSFDTDAARGAARSTLAQADAVRIVTED